MKVRLKRELRPVFAIVCALFQFHEGPIKTLSLCLTRQSVQCFNSMKVRLKLSVAVITPALADGLNSMKVRLKPIYNQLREKNYDVSIP